MAVVRTNIVAGREVEATGRFWGVLASVLTRGLVSGGLVWATCNVGWVAAGEWHARQRTEESLEKAMRFDPGNGAHAAARARIAQNSMRGDEAGAVVRQWERAVRLNANRATWWAELGEAYEWAGRPDDALRAFERARELFPRSPEINWKLGNFYLRAGRNAEALDALRRVLGSDPETERAVFDLVWRAGFENREILDELVPADALALVGYLNFLVEAKRINAAKEAWARLIAQGQKLSAQSAFPYLDALIQHGESEELRRAWSAVEEGMPGSARGPADRGNEIMNRGFEGAILNGGLDWRVIPAEGVRVTLDSMTFFDVTRSLRIDFDGRQNLAYSHVLQFVPVRPNTGYRFLAYLRAQGITSDSGPRIEIYDNGDRGRLFLSTADVRGTTSWVPRSVDFRTSGETRVLVVRVARPVSKSLDGRIGGTAWIDRVSLRAVE